MDTWRMTSLEQGQGSCEDGDLDTSLPCLADLSLPQLSMLLPEALQEAVTLLLGRLQEGQDLLSSFQAAI